jgi:hypothetical protein
MHVSAIIEAEYSGGDETDWHSDLNNNRVVKTKYGRGKWAKEIPGLKARVGPFSFMLGFLPMTVAVVVPVKVGFDYQVTAHAEARSTLSASRRVFLACCGCFASRDVLGRR